MVPFDVVSLYTNVSLRDMLQICTNVLYKGHLGSALNLFSEFMRLATEGVELSFNNTMYFTNRLGFNGQSPGPGIS